MKQLILRHDASTPLRTGNRKSLSVTTSLAHRLLLFLTLLVMGVNSSWAEDHISNFTELTKSSATISDTYGSLSGGSWSNSSYSFSNGGTFTVTAESGYVVKEVVITYSAKDNNRVGGAPTISDDTNYAYSCSNATGTITCNGTAQNSVGITMTNTARIIAVSVTWSDASGGATLSSECNMLSAYYVPSEGDNINGVLDETNNKWIITVPYDAPSDKLTIKFTASAGATAYSNNEKTNRITYSGGVFTIQKSLTSATNAQNVYFTAEDGTTTSQWRIELVRAPKLVTDITLNKQNLYLAYNTSETLTATVTPDDATKSINWSSDNSNVTVSDAGVVTAKAQYGDKAVITATAADGSGVTATCNVYAYRFSPGGGTVTTYTAGESGNSTTVQVNFPDSENFDITAGNFTFESSNSGVINVTGYGYSSNKLTFTPTVGQAGTATLTITYTGSNENYYGKTCTINYTVNAATPTYNVNATAGEGGTVSSSVDLTNPINEGTSITFTATPEEWYQVENWYNGQNKLADSQTTYTTTVNSDLDVKVNFARYYKINLETNNAEYGEVTLTGGIVNEPILKGTNITIKATPKEGYRLANWMLNSVPQGAELSVTNKVENLVGAETKSVATITAVFEEIPVDPTKVGAEDNTTPYAGAHSLVYTLAAGKTRHITFKNYSAKTQNWDNWILSVGSTEDLAVPTSAEDPADIMMLRADNYDILQKSQLASEFNWDTFKADMDGSTVVMDVTNSGKHIYVNSTITTAGGKTYKYSAICNDRTDAGTDAYFCFTVERSHITDLSVSDETKAYKLSYAIKEGNTENYGDTYGTVTIKNLKDLALRDGTYVPNGETITFSAAPKAGYSFVNWSNGTTTSERQLTIDGSQDVVAPVAVFAKVFTISTQPNSKSYNYKATASALTVAATSSYTLSYQWYSNTEDNNTNGTIIPDANSATYIPATTAVGTTYYYCVITEGTTNAELTSSTAKIDVAVAKPSVSTPENIVTLKDNNGGATLYFTLDKSDPRTSDTRIEYTPNTVAIREGMTKVRAVACVDGIYSEIQGTDVTYEHVTVLEARGKKVNAQTTFTNSTCVTSVAFDNEAKDVTWPVSPNSEIDSETIVYRAKSKTSTISLTSTSANKIVIGAYSSSSTPRTLSSILVDGVKLTSSSDYEIKTSGSSTTNNGSMRRSHVDRVVIVLKDGHEIKQNSDVTFNFSGEACICYYEIYGTSKTDFCKMPEVAPASYSSTDNLWSYTLTPADGTTMKYVVVDLDKGEPLAGYPKESTSAVTISKSNEENLKEGLMIRAWSVDPAGIKVASERNFIMVESLLSPVLKFNIKEAIYNKDDGKYTTDTPWLTVYPSYYSTGVTFTSDDPSVGRGTNGWQDITIGEGQGVTMIKASLIINEGVEGMKGGTYTAELKLVVSDGVAYALSESEKGNQPKIRTNIELRDPKTNDLLLTMMYGGYKYKNGQFNGEQKEDSKTHEIKDVFDSWGTIEEFVGYGDDLPAVKKYVDGFSYNSQATQDARSEAMAKNMATEGSKVWFSTSETKPDGTNYAKYERIKPFSLPVRGAYFTFQPEENGVLTLYVLQNGSLNTEKKNEKDYVTGLSANPRTYYWFDQDGWRIEPTSVTVKQPLTFGTDAKTVNNEDVISSVLESWKSRSEYTGDIEYKNSLDKWENQEAVNTNLNEANPEPQPIIRYQEGFCLLQKAYAKYVVNVVAGKTYYFFSNNSKLGFAGVNFKKTTVPNVTVNQTLALTQTDIVANTIKPAQTTVYKTATLNRTFKKNTWNTITLPFALSESQIEKVFGAGTKVVLYNGTTGSDKVVKVFFLEHVDQNILPGQPYFILPTGVDKNGNDLASVSDEKIGGNGGLTFNNVCVSADVALQSYGSNVYPSSGREDFEFVGTFEPTDVYKNDYYINANTGDLTQYTGTNATKMNTYRAYLKNLPTSQAKIISSVDFCTIFDDIEYDDNVATGIMNVLVNDMNMEIRPTNGVYNLSGQKVAESTKNLPTGIYIVNGKKISIK